MTVAKIRPVSKISHLPRADLPVLVSLADNPISSVDTVSFDRNNNVELHFDSGIFFPPPSQGRVLQQPPKPQRELGGGQPGRGRVSGRVWGCFFFSGVPLQSEATFIASEST